MKLLGTLKKGLIFVISAPAGTGKTTLVRMLIKEFDCVVENISYTTRSIRPQEIEGRDYYFITKEAFQKKIEEKEFLEYAEVFGSYYGTSKYTIDKICSSGKHVVLIIDTQGAEQLRGVLDAVYIFICPPNLAELEQRLHGRKSDTPAAITTRLSWAKKEIEASKRYDYKIVNENLTTAYEVLRSIFIAEEHRNRLN